MENAARFPHLHPPDYDYGQLSKNRVTLTFHLVQKIGQATGSLDHFLIERYCLYATSRNRGEIHHLPWELQEAKVDLAASSMARRAGITLPEKPEIAHFARELKVLFWAPERLL